MYARRDPPEDPPCGSCREVLLPENDDAGEVFSMVRNQVISIGESVVDINHIAVDAAIQRLGVENASACFHKVVRVFHNVLNDRR